MSDVDVKFGADTREIDQGAERVKKDIRSIDDETGKLSKSLGRLAGQFVAALAVRQVWAFAQAVGDAAERTEQLAQMTGLSSQEVRQWGAIAQASGKNVEQIAGAVGKLEQSFVKAAAGGAAQSAALRTLDIDISSVTSSQDALLKIAARFSTMEDGPRKTAAAMALMGRSGKEMIPILNSGAEAIQNQIDRATELGAVWGRTGAEQDAFEQKGLALDSAFDELGQSMSGIGNMMVDSFAPAVYACIEAFSQWTAGMVRSYREGGTVKAMMDVLVGTFRVVATGAALVGSAMVQAFHYAVAGAVYAVAAVDAVSRAIGRMLKGDYEGAGRAWGESMQRAGQIARGEMAAVRDNIKSTTGFISNVWSGKTPPATGRPRGGFDTSGGDTSASADKAKAAADKAAREAERELQKQIAIAQRISDSKVRISANELDTIRDMQKQRLQDEEASLEQAVTMGIITERQKVARISELRAQDLQEEQSTEDMIYQIHAQGLEDQLALAGLEVEDRRILLQKKEEMEAEHVNRMRLIRQKMDSQAKESSRDASQAAFNHWKGVLGPIGGAFSQVTQGLLTRTMSWRDAFLQIGNTVLSQFIGWCTQMGINWLAKELAQTTATAAGAAVRVGTEATAAAATTTITTGSALAQIAAHAAVAAAGAYAALAAIPFVGPFLAPVAAAAALAGVLALGKSIFSAEGGWGEVSHDGATTQLHKKEMVLPASIATPLRAAIADGSVGTGGFGGGGGRRGGDTINISAWDSRDVNRFMRTRARSVQEGLDRNRRNLQTGEL